MDQIVGSNRATTVLSPAKYPAPAVLPNWKPLYSELDLRSCVTTKTKFDASPVVTAQVRALGVLTIVARWIAPLFSLLLDVPRRLASSWLIAGRRS